MKHILHISDIHFGPKFVPEVADGVLDLIDRRRPDLVVISGDVTQRAKIHQFQDARAWVDSLPVPSITVPGNHDVPAYRVHERLFAPYGVYQRYFDENMEPVFEDDDLFVIGVNTAFKWTVKDGRFTGEALQRLEDLLSAAASDPARKDKCRIVVAHHHLTPPPRWDTQRITGRAVEAVDIMSRHGVHMVLSGHLHQTYIATSEEYFPSGRDPVLFVHSGTTTSSRGRGWEKKRNSCNWIEVDDRVLTFHHLLWSEEARRFREWRRQTYPRQGSGEFDLMGRLPDAID